MCSIIILSVVLSGFNIAQPAIILIKQVPSLHSIGVTRSLRPGTVSFM
jgi:hypothetical protein